ncbi:RICIN domain-containing protein [Streptosporangium sp. G11]|uniref:RICIN domain-containing protein n=1 Tax=Streptosporangium sp. G11 TaxID=3436926 RepID=UPI003EBE55E4
MLTVPSGEPVVTYHRITNRNSGKCLNVTGGLTADGALLEQRACGTGASFQWSRQ